MKKILLSLCLVALAPLSGYAAVYTFSTPNLFTGNGGNFATASALQKADGTNYTSWGAMTHGSAYTWGLDSTTYGSNYNNLITDVKTSGLHIVSATLTIKNIWDWTGEGVGQDPADALYVNILGGLGIGYHTSVFSTTGQGAANPDWSTAVNPFVTAGAGSYNAYLKANETGGFTFADATVNSLLKANAIDTAVGTPATVSWSDPSGGSATSSDLVLTFTTANMDALALLLKGDTANSGAPTVGIGFGPECHYYDTGITLSVTTMQVPDGGSSLGLLALGIAGMVGFRRLSRFSGKAARKL